MQLQHAAALWRFLKITSDARLQSTQRPWRVSMLLCRRLGALASLHVCGSKCHIYLKTHTTHIYIYTYVIFTNMFMYVCRHECKSALGLPWTMLQGSMRLEAAAWKIAFYRSPSGAKPLLVVCMHNIYICVCRHALCMFLYVFFGHKTNCSHVSSLLCACMCVCVHFKNLLQNMHAILTEINWSFLHNMEIKFMWFFNSCRQVM